MLFVMCEAREKTLPWKTIVFADDPLALQKIRRLGKKSRRLGAKELKKINAKELEARKKRAKRKPYRKPPGNFPL